MQLGFVSAILPDEPLEKVLHIASTIGYDCVELMCWPIGKANRRYAGVTHIDVNKLNNATIDNIHQLCAKYKVNISGLGYYANPLVDNPDEANAAIAQIKQLINAASSLGVSVVNTFIGRDHTKSVEENWPRFTEVWTDIMEVAEQYNIRIGIENCPMFFTNDEWPGGKNLGTTPRTWRRMFAEMKSDKLGLNYDPSHMIWQHMDYLKPIKEFRDRLFHIHAKDVRINQEQLDEVGIMAPPNDWHSPKLPGLGDVHWGKFFSTLTSIGYNGPVCVEVEDRAYEGSLEKRIASLVQSHSYLRQFIPKTMNI